MDVHTPYWDSSVVAQAACGGAHCACTVHVHVYRRILIHYGEGVHAHVHDVHVTREIRATCLYHTEPLKKS